MIADHEYLERVVAGIQAVTNEKADVTWNEVINGRQFDVVVRFNLEALRYLVLIEVKNRIRKAQASDIDAFVSKARDQKADKAIFVTAAGFQTGAISVAKRHDVDLYTVTFDEKEVTVPQDATIFRIPLVANPHTPPHLSVGDPVLVANIEQVRLVYDDATTFDVPTEQSQMTYYCLKTKLRDGRSLHDILQTMNIPEVKLGQSFNDQFELDPPLYFEPPDLFFYPPGVVALIKYKVTGRNARPIRGNIRVDPNFFTYPVVYTNVITGASSRFALDQLPLGVERVSEGNFYFCYHPLAYYYCEAIKGDSIKWWMVESFQNGEIVQAITTQNIKYSNRYIPVSDKTILKRIRARLDAYRQTYAAR